MDTLDLAASPASTLHLVAPEHRDLAKSLLVFDPERDSLAQMRAGLLNAYAAAAPAEPVTREEIHLPGPAGAPDVRALIYRPGRAARSLPAILYMHGGGYIAGKPDMTDAAQLKLANDTGALVVAVDYRLAPETPFPGALEDCYAALCWLAREALRIGADPARLLVLGDSAGGGLAAALALLARDRSGPALAAQVLIYPMLDARTGDSNFPLNNPATGEFVWTRAANRFAWRAYRGETDLPEARVGHFSPALAPEVFGLPHTFIGVGSIDLFLDENVAYAMRLSHAGVPIELHVYDGGFHAFDRMPSPLADRFNSDVISAIRKFFRNNEREIELGFGEGSGPFAPF